MTIGVSCLPVWVRKGFFAHKKTPLFRQVEILYHRDADKSNVFCIFYQDFSEDQGKYYGKTLRVKGIIGTKNLPKDVCVFGRYIMTCCIDDTEFKGFICNCPKGSLLKNKSWVIVTAELRFEDNEFYEEKGPVMYAKKIELTSPPEEEIATFF